jgi:predicted RND superfamily exporter protein
MWTAIGSLILRNKIKLIVILLVITAFLGYRGSKIELSYEMARVLPVTDSTYQGYVKFKSIFGEDGNLMVIGIQDSELFKLDKFNNWYDLANNIKKINGIKDVVSAGITYNIIRNDEKKRFDLKPIVPTRPTNQATVDSIATVISSLPFYNGLIYNPETKATIMAISFDKYNLNSKHRIEIVNEIKRLGDEFVAKTHTKLHYSSMPYIRTEFMKIVSSEMKLFFLLAIIVTSIILIVFFRSFSVVPYSLIVVVIGVIWSLGTMELMGYKISILSGLIPPLIVIIGIPNCIFLINKYHAEYAIHHNKAKALNRMIAKVGLTLLLANITTAIGFGVFYFTGSALLVEFGNVAAINVMSTYVISLILIPIIFSFLPPPSASRTKHLNAIRINKTLHFIDYIVHKRRRTIYLIITLLIVLSIYGMTKIRVDGYVVDDLPKKHTIYSDLRFFERNFKGVLPFEIFIDTKQPNGVFAYNAKTIYKIKLLQKKLSIYPELSKPISLVEGLKFYYQAYKGGDPKFYVTPTSTELKNLTDFASDNKASDAKLKSYIDSTRRYTRISYQIADIGSAKMKVLVVEIQAKIDSIFKPADYNVTLTGHSLVFLKNNDYLLRNLYESLLIEIFLITLIGIVLFRSVRIIILSKIPCLVPLFITAGIMGFTSIEFKSSTILIFTIALGIASDGTIYFLTKYRHELQKNMTVSQAVSLTIKETGLSMIYTSMILFCGFGIFAASSFGGTIALGILVSITLLVSICTNLVLLPAILLSISKYTTKYDFKQTKSIELLEDEDEIKH